MKVIYYVFNNRAVISNYLLITIILMVRTYTMKNTGETKSLIK